MRNRRDPTRSMTLHRSSGRVTLSKCPNCRVARERDPTILLRQPVLSERQIGRHKRQWMIQTAGLSGEISLEQADFEHFGERECYRSLFMFGHNATISP